MHHHVNCPIAIARKSWGPAPTELWKCQEGAGGEAVVKVKLACLVDKLQVKNKRNVCGYSKSLGV